MNPFSEKGSKIETAVESFEKIYPKSYCKDEVDPYTKTRIILMNGTEFEANWFSHQFSRHTDNNDLRRELALTRFIEKQQQLKISLLKPANETILEHTVSYEQLAVDLTAELAKREADENVRKALDFALLEDFDHLYRYSNLLEMETGVRAERLVGKLTEITPGRPTIAHHRFPKDNIRPALTADAKKESKLHAMIITAAEQQTMNYYMNVSTLYQSDIGRKLYEEIALVEEEHVSQYGSLIDPSSTWLECLLWHEYCECYLYWSCYKTETDPAIRALWEENLSYEISHLHRANELLERYEKKNWQEVIQSGTFPEPLKLHSNIDYVREVLAETVEHTSCRETYLNVSKLPENADFYAHQKRICPGTPPSHTVIEQKIALSGEDYRFETAKNPIPALRDRKKDNTELGVFPDHGNPIPFREENYLQPRN